MDGKIGLEEHFAIPETLNDSAGFVPDDHWPELRSRILDIHERRLRLMDAHGMQMMLLSLNAPAVQAIPDPKRADDIARRANNFLAEQVSKRPDRFQALAALPMQDPDLASRELRRCVNELGFRGALVNGFSQVNDANSAFYYDLPQYWPFWGVVENLNVPFYLHPRYPLEDRSDMLGHPWLRGSVWSFGVETATHALRLMTCGLFDKYPRLTLVLGHLGETLPNTIWRVDHRIGAISRGIPAKRKLADVLRENVYATTSGNFCTTTLLNTMLVMGADHVLFAADHPFEKMREAAEWFDHLDAISENDWLKIARTNAEKLLNL